MKAVIFDLDGVITNTENFHYLAWKEAFELVNKQITKVDYEKNLQSRKRSEGILNVIPDASERIIEKISSQKSVSFEHLINNQQIEVFEDALGVIKHLYNNNINMAVASSSSYANQIVEKLNLQKYFKFILNGNDITNNKPSPEIYLLACEKLNVNSKDVLVIEDSQSGVRAGLLAGTKVIAIKRSSTSKYVKSKNLTIVTELKINIFDKS